MTIKVKKRIIAIFVIAVIFFVSVGKAIVNPEVIALSDSSNGFNIIMYHHITEDKEKIGDYVISTEQLEEDLKYLRDRGYKTLLMRDLYSIDKGEKKLPEKAIMLTFDDGQESFYKYVFPLLKKYNFSAVLSVIGKYTEQFSNINDHNILYSHVTWDQINEMVQSGIVEIGNHSYDMHNNNGVGRSGVTINSGENINDYKKAITGDINTLNSLFEKNLGFAPSFYTYPFGRFSKETENILKERGYMAALTCHEIKNVPHSSRDWLFRLGRYNRSGKINTSEFFKKLA